MSSSRHRIGIWIEAARPRTLSAAVAPVAVGTAAATRFIGWRAAAALVVALSIQVGVNYANDLFDAERGVDTEHRVGPRRAVATGLVTTHAMRIAMILAFAVAGATGLSLVFAVGPQLLLVGVLSLVAALGYSGGPRPYASFGLGEVMVFLFFGVVATVGSAYVQEESLSRVAYVASIPVGLLATSILVVNNLRDLETDRAAGKNTLAVRIGASKTRWLYQALIVMAFVTSAAVAVVVESLMPLFSLVAAPLAVGPVTNVKYGRAPQDLVRALGATGRLHLVHGVLLALGLWLS